jgi:hypothetical protein
VNENLQRRATEDHQRKWLENGEGRAVEERLGCGNSREGRTLTSAQDAGEEPPKRRRVGGTIGKGSVARHSGERAR